VATTVFHTSSEPAMADAVYSPMYPASLPVSLASSAQRRSPSRNFQPAEPSSWSGFSAQYVSARPRPSW